MKIRVQFLPGILSKYFNMDAVEVLNLPEGCTYSDVMKLLEKKFKSGEMGRSFLDAFIIMSGGESIIRKLDEEVRPGDDVTVVSIVLGG
ncbi:MAG: hypothetical protein J7K49_02760 [Thaumarchaeota archaeon]|nr:hypothetical protein [Nitrososphaerota archaeon]